MAVDATPLLGPRTGIGVFAAEVVAGLAARADVELRAYAASWRGRRQLADELPAGAAAVRRPMAARPLRAAWERVDRPAIEWWTGAIDLVHGTNYVVPPSRRAAQLVSVHDLTPVRHPEMSTADTRRFPRMIRRAVRRGAAVHTCSSFVAGEITEVLGVDADRVHVVPYGIRPDPPGDGGVGSRVAGGERYVLAVGTLEPRKGLVSLVRAFDALAATDEDLRLVLAGRPGWGTDELEAAVSRAHHRDRIVVPGWISADERAGLLAGAGCLAFPSRYEGFGFPPLEAMAAGTPVVATAAGAIPEVVGDAALLVEVGDDDALAAAIEKVLTDEALAADLVERGARRVTAFRWEDTVDALVALYRRVVAGD